MMMAVGAGALVTSITLAGIRSEVTKGKLFLYFGIVSGIAPVILALSGNMPLALVGAAAMGASQAGFMTITHTIIQSIIPDHIRGRVGGIYSVHIGGTMATVNLLNGSLADFVHAPLLLIVGGISFVGIVILSTQYPTMRRIYSRGLPPRLAEAAAD
jgi:MFS family permease